MQFLNVPIRVNSKDPRPYKSTQQLFIHCSTFNDLHKHCGNTSVRHTSSNLAFLKDILKNLMNKLFLNYMYNSDISRVNVIHYVEFAWEHFYNRQ